MTAPPRPAAFRSFARRLELLLDEAAIIAELVLEVQELALEVRHVDGLTLHLGQNSPYTFPAKFAIAHRGINMVKYS